MQKLLINGKKEFDDDFENVVKNNELNKGDKFKDKEKV